MYIQPQSVFKILSGVPFDNTHKHTILFDNASQQLAYFNSKVSHTFTDFTYVKKDNIVRVPLSSDAIYQCNYCMFQNVGYGNKWFFGFITDIEYVNNAVSSLSITIDDFQTWLFDVEIGNSFVEREHVADDTIGRHTVPEPINYGENVVMKVGEYFFGDWKVIIQAIPNTLKDTFGEASGKVINSLYTGANLYKTDLNADSINSTIDQLLSQGYSIINIYECPESFTRFGQIYLNNETTGNTLPTAFSLPTISSDSYTPTNKKLFTYPYVFLRVDNQQGSYSDFKFENMPGNIIAFQLLVNYINTVNCTLYPVAYESALNSEQSLTINNFPVCSWNENAFLNFVSMQFLTSTLASLVSLNAMPLFSEFTKSLVSPQAAKGNFSDANTLVQYDYFGYKFYTMGIKPEFAKIVDDYFTRWGYEVDVYKVPDLKTRTSFNYIKTRECRVVGSAPSDAITAIENNYNNGITLWHTTDVGNYSLDNSIRR